MKKHSLKIYWTRGAKIDLENIYNYYKDKSESFARQIRGELLNAPKSVVFPKQYQVDEIDNRFRRIIIRHYKVLYGQSDGFLYIHRIFDARQNPKKLKLH